MLDIDEIPTGFAVAMLQQLKRVVGQDEFHVHTKEVALLHIYKHPVVLYEV